ncbi:MAG TPA: aldehyde dehydrogenase family protein [Tissierellia bacterium]|jgi:aldehyde dehydrogenase (NAD+)|nr:aldehyde dehydrogenase family protein [Tissierellia bacterium]
MTNKLYYNGKWQDPLHQDTIAVENPATREIIAHVPAASEEEVNLAIEHAARALPDWRATPVEKRIELMEKFVTILESRQEKLAEIITSELGTPVRLALNMHVRGYLQNIRNDMKIAKTYPWVDEYDGYKVYKESVGVVACLTPWNYPMGQVILKIVPALLAGNVVLLKPSQKTPLVAYEITKAIDEAGFPAGVFSLLPGRGAEVGNVLATHPLVNLVTFTGSTKGGTEVAKLAQDDVKRVVLELGGKSPSVILEGADLELALKRTLDKVFLNTGQTCSAFSRLLVPKSMKEEIEKLACEKIKNYSVGDPLDKDVRIGPLNGTAQKEKVLKYMNIAKEEGARLLCGGEYEELEGYYFPPTIFTDVDNLSRLAQEEIFGPILCITEYDGIDEAIRLANETVYGLSGAVFGPEKEAFHVASNIRAGVLVVNDGKQTTAGPFGGMKHSGYGREGGIYGFEPFVELKVIYGE